MTQQKQLTRTQLIAVYGRISDIRDKVAGDVWYRLDVQLCASIEDHTWYTIMMGLRNRNGV
jgi:hypothetical protein